MQGILREHIHILPAYAGRSTKQTVLERWGKFGVWCRMLQDKCTGLQGEPVLFVGCCVVRKETSNLNFEKLCEIQIKAFPVVDCYSWVYNVSVRNHVYTKSYL